MDYGAIMDWAYYKELDEFDGKFNLLSYHIPYLKQFCSEFDVRGKDILEVGGAMPPEIVIDYLGANSWTCTEDPMYDVVLGGMSNQQTINVTSRRSAYTTILKNIEDFDASMSEKFDCIFSIACFEHISKLPEALNKMWSVLKPGGKLFSMFSPIWSCHEGHHLYHLTLPERFLEKNIKNILDPWEHLLKTRTQLHSDLQLKFDSEFADRVMYEVFNNPHINRYFSEDYRHVFQNSLFRLDKFFPTFQITIPEIYHKNLELTCRGYREFSNMGFYVYISK
jgi:SAM-dependent methyltransferase